MTLNPAMSQQEMDTFLSSLGAGHNPFSVQTQHCVPSQRVSALVLPLPADNMGVSK